MRDWLEELFVVLAHSTRAQVAIVLGISFFTGLMFAGEYAVGRVQVHGLLAPLTEVFREWIGHRYDKAAWGALLSFLLVAVKFYRRDRKRLLGS